MNLLFLTLISLVVFLVLVEVILRRVSFISKKKIKSKIKASLNEIIKINLSSKAHLITRYYDAYTELYETSIRQFKEFYLTLKIERDKASKSINSDLTMFLLPITLFVAIPALLLSLFDDYAAIGIEYEKIIELKGSALKIILTFCLLITGLPYILHRIIRIHQTYIDDINNFCSLHIHIIEQVIEDKKDC